MENKSVPPARKGGGKSKKLTKMIAFFTCVVLIFVSIFVYCANNYAYGYKYYQTFENNSVVVGQTLAENFLQTSIQQKLDMLEDDGYIVAGYSFNTDIIAKQTIVYKPSAKDDTDLNKIIQDNIDVEVLLTQLSIEGDDGIYYFKTDEECNAFVSELNEISRVETTSEGTIGSYKLVSDQDTLNLAEQAFQKRVAEKRAKQVQVTSRGGSTSRNSSYNAPMASYVYISSEYGPRWGRQHTGVDFAANSGTQIYA